VPRVSLEFILMLGYAISLASIALLLELAARHAHRRSLSISTVGFTYHPDRDIWRCPEEQHLFPVFADTAKGTVVYRAPASACNACRSKPGCTDSDNGREIERKNASGLQFGMQRFHRAMSLTLLVLANLILIVEIFRINGLYPRFVLAGVLTLLCILVMRLSKALLPGADGA
jgi:heme A synthase